MGVRKWLEKSAEKQKHKLRKTLNPLSRKAFQAVSFSATKDKTKGNCFCSCLLFWVSPPRGRLHPPKLKCSGRQSRLSAKIFACGENACAAQKRRGPEGPLGCPSVNESKAGNIDFNRPFVLGSADQKAGWVISSHNLSMNSIPQSLLIARKVINTCKI